MALWIAWVLRHRLVCAIRRHPSEVRYRRELEVPLQHSASRGHDTVSNAAGWSTGCRLAEIDNRMESVQSVARSHL